MYDIKDIGQSVAGSAPVALSGWSLLVPEHEAQLVQGVGLLLSGLSGGEIGIDNHRGMPMGMLQASRGAWLDDDSATFIAHDSSHPDYRRTGPAAGGGRAVNRYLTKTTKGE